MQPNKNQNKKHQNSQKKKRNSLKEIREKQKTEISKPHLFIVRLANGLIKLPRVLDRPRDLRRRRLHKEAKKKKSSKIEYKTSKHQ